MTDSQKRSTQSSPDPHPGPIPWDHPSWSLVEEDHGLSQVGSSLDDVDDAFRADPGQFFGLGLVEQVVQVAQGLLQFQGLVRRHKLGLGGWGFRGFQENRSKNVEVNT